MKQLQSSKPLCYMLQNADKITALPYIDEQIPQYKNKIQYLIKTQQQDIQYSQQKYLGQLYMPKLSYIGTQKFQQEVARIKAKLQHNKNNQNNKQKDKTNKNIYQQINISMLSKPGKLSQQTKSKIQKAAVAYQNNIIKQINLQLYQKFGPYLQKQYINALDKKKILLISAIQKQKQAIQQINKHRQYQQMQAKEREQTIRDRIKVMIYKKKKIQ